MGKWGRPGRREEPRREKAGLFLVVILGAPWAPPAPWPRPACPAISAPPRQRKRLRLAVATCTECPPQPLRSRSAWRAPAAPGPGGARVGRALCPDPSGRPAPFPCGRPPGTPAALVRRRSRRHPTLLVIINPDTWPPRPPTPVPASATPPPPSPSTSGLGLRKGDSEAPSKNKLPSRMSPSPSAPPGKSPSVCPGRTGVGRATAASSAGLGFESSRLRRPSVSLPLTPKQESASKRGLLGSGCSAFPIVWALAKRSLELGDEGRVSGIPETWPSWDYCQGFPRDGAQDPMFIQVKATGG